MGSFPSSDIKDYPCKEFEHCKIPCRDKPKCVPNTECRVEWKIGEGTKTNVEMTNRVGVDGDGAYELYLFHYIVKCTGSTFSHRVILKKLHCTLCLIRFGKISDIFGDFSILNLPCFIQINTYIYFNVNIALFCNLYA